MAKGSYYLPLYYQRLLTSTTGWKDEAFGAYLKLLIFQYDKGYIPEDMKELSRIAPSVKRNWKVFSSKFVKISDGKLANNVMEKIRAANLEKNAKRLENGKLGGRPKNQTVIKNETETKPIPITNNQIREKEYVGERGSYPPAPGNGSEEKFPIERCLEIALVDGRWIRSNKTNKTELLQFNALLEARAVYEKNPADYKSHFANWKLTGKKTEVQSSAPTPASGPQLKKL